MKKYVTHPFIWISLLWAFVLHRPALLNFGKAIPGSENGDTLRGHWSAWAVSQDIWPIDTALCVWPFGAYFLPLPPLSLTIISPITQVFSPQVGLSLLVFGHCLLTIWGMYFLARSLDIAESPALLSGLLLSTTPMLAETLQAGVYEYQTIGWTALCFGAMIRSYREHPAWGLLAALFYMITTLECGYYGSAAALGCIVISIAFVRSKAGLLGGLIAAATVAGLAYGCYQLIEPALGKFTGNNAGVPQKFDFRVSIGVAELKAAIPGLSPPPPPPGQPAPYISSPSLFHWVLFVAGAIVTLRKSWWATLLAILYLLIAINSPATQWWSEGELGKFARILRYFATPMGLMISLVIAFGVDHLLQRKASQWNRQICFLVALGGAAFGASSTILKYPLLWLPTPPDFALKIQKDPRPGAVIVYPQEQHTKKNRLATHDYLSTNTSFRNPQARIWIQTLINRPMLHHSKLGTLIPKNNQQLQLSRGTITKPELQQLVQQGLRYLIVDNSQLTMAQKQQFQGVQQSMNFSCTLYDEWGGISLCLLQSK